MSILTKISSELNELVGENFQQKKYLLATSGGIDSMVMLDVFERLSLNFEVAHCNFKLRDKESDLDEVLIKDVCVSKGVNYHIQEFDTKSILEKEGGNLQETARNLRYNWFNSMLSNFDYLVTAHHLNDNIETFFINLSRGSGLKGLSGIPKVNGQIIRPLLNTSKVEILEHAQEYNVIWRDDASNKTDKYIRNTYRNKILPMIKESKPNFDSVMESNIERIWQSNELLNHLISQVKNDIVEESDSDLVINLEKLNTFPNSTLLLFKLISEFEFNYNQVENILSSTESGKVIHTDNFQLIKDRKQLILKPITKIENVSQQFDTLEELLESNIVLDYEFLTHPITFSTEKSIMYFDLKKINFPVTLRTWKKGDVIIPLGMKGKKKVSDILIDSKVSIDKKQTILVLEDTDKVLSLVGLRNSEEVKITPQTKKAIKIVTLSR